MRFNQQFFALADVTAASAKAGFAIINMFIFENDKSQRDETLSLYISCTPKYPV
jgi:hypothetical protein